MALKKGVDIATPYDTKTSLLHVIDEQIQQCAVDYCLSYEVVKQLEPQNRSRTGLVGAIFGVGRVFLGDSTGLDWLPHSLILK